MYAYVVSIHDGRHESIQASANDHGVPHAQNSPHQSGPDHRGRH